MSESAANVGRPSVNLSAHSSASLASPGSGLDVSDAWNIAALALAGLCCCSAIAVVYTKHLSRAVWADISVSRAAIDELSVDWSRLQIEQSTFSDHGRVERAARDRLGMTYPSLETTRFIVSEPSRP